ncbi:transposase (plasmid) [Acaryochloris marina MBIC11017]|uniref:Transposase n=1 Tax=Acaryochloris marina (strain MBIC 11017) TaxID=329726 RepID=A8ZLF1_ACAM1|nr:transposase [Acaryochloris marina MBIC11017]
MPKIGWVPITLHRPIPDDFDIKTVRVVRKHSGWYVVLCIQADVSIPEVPPHGHSIGIDVGLEYFLSTSDGEQIARPRFFNKLHRKLELLQRCLKRKQKRSNQRAKLIQRIGRVHEQIAASRLDWQFKLAHHLCDQAQTIFAEDLDFRIMAKGMLGKHTLDAGLGQFLNVVLPWVCFKRGVYYVKVDPNGTSQECPDCGARVKKDLSVRIHECHECGSVKPRDVASGQVINARGLSGVQIASGRDLSGFQVTDARQDRTKLEYFKSNLEKPALYA